VAQDQETSEASRKASLVQTNVIASMVVGAGARSERNESEPESMLDSHVETPQNHTVSEKGD